MNISVKHSFSFPNSKIWKRFRAGIVLAAVLFTVLPRTFLTACYAAAAQSGRYEWEDAPSPEEYDEVIAIVHTNDVHGFIEHEPYVKGFADQLKAGGKYDLVLTVSGGDVYTGGYVAAHGYDGELIPALMGRVYDVMTCGNNDERLPGNSYAVALLAALCESEGLHCLAGNRVIGDEPFDLKSYAESYEPVIGAADFAALYKAVDLRPDGSLDWSRLDRDGFTTVLAHSSFHLNADRVSAKDEGGAVRMNETNLGDLVADGLLSIGKEMTGGKAAIALFPAYRMRSSLEPGDINKGDIYSVFATSIPVYEKRMNAQTLFEWISDSIKYAGIREYKYFRQISGMKVEYSAGEKENTIYRLTIGDTVIYENGAFCVDDDWSVDCVYGLTDQTNIDNSDPGNMLIPNNKELIERFCQYLEKEEETIYPDIIAPDGRITPH